ncbi:uncharacterized protein LOC34620335 [Cyclospora cayetanensis]|uniref:Uncharacterized protein LOC34620335 n=1 Tax=Cyclospora cayetanensis TaxID=88456 RepID=A0A6P6RY97_9EIME|nr:uncharacterized protein LOC34620335 [Cyclospora cayetanensis]
MICDPRRHASALVKAWTSHASSQQRSGRTGRVFPGVCIRLVTSSFYQNCLRVFDLPEMQTAPLDKLYITVAHLTKRLNAIAQAANPMSPTGSQRNTAIPQRTDRHNTIQECMRTGSLTPSQLLLLTVQPPPMSALAAAQDGLREQGALDSNGEITRLGYLMMQLPIDVRLCKLVFLGIVFGCPLDAVVMASCLSSTDLFAFPALMLLQRHSKASAGLEAALQLQQQLKTRALFDGGQFSEPLMLRNCFVEFLLHFAASTAELRGRLARQAAPSRSRRLELNMKVEYNRAAREFGRIHAVLPKRLVQTTLLCCDLCQRVIKLLDASSAAYKNLQFLLKLLQDGSIFTPHLQQQSQGRAAGDTQLQKQPHQQQQQPQQQEYALQHTLQTQLQQTETTDFTSGVSYDPAAAAAAVEARFSSDALLLKTLLAASFSPSFMLGKVKNCIDGQQLSEMPTKADSEAPEGSTAVFSWLVDRGVDLSRCLFFNKTSSLEKVSQIHAALAAVLPGVDFVLLFTGDPSSPYLCIKASSAAAAEDPAVAALASHRPPECLYSSLILYLPPTPRNECFHFDHRAAAVAAVEYKQQLRTPPTAAAVVKQQQQRQKRIEQLRSARFQRRGGESGDDDRRNAADERLDDAGGCGCIDIGVPSLHDVSDLKQINERVAQAEQIRGRHIQPCRLFSSLPACAQLINQFACGRWKFTLPLPKPQTQTDVDAVDLFRRVLVAASMTDLYATGASWIAPSSGGALASFAFFFTVLRLVMIDTMRFFAECCRSGSSVPTMFEVMRPMSPFGVTWYFVGPQESVSGNSGAAAGKSGKAVKVQGILSYRSPMGVLSVCPEAVKTSAGRSRVFKQVGRGKGAATAAAAAATAAAAAATAAAAAAAASYSPWSSPPTERATLSARLAINLRDGVVPAATADRDADPPENVQTHATGKEILAAAAAVGCRGGHATQCCERAFRRNMAPFTALNEVSRHRPKTPTPHAACASSPWLPGRESAAAAASKRRRSRKRLRAAFCEPVARSLHCEPTDTHASFTGDLNCQKRGDIYTFVQKSLMPERVLRAPTPASPRKAAAQRAVLATSRGIARLTGKSYSHDVSDSGKDVLGVGSWR